jgi:signal transduction histidine kinase
VKILSSLRSRLLLGALFWTLGLFVAALLISTAFLTRHGSWPRILHGSADFYGHEYYAITIFFAVAGLLAVRSGLLPLTRLRQRLAAVHEGKDRRLDGTYPAEVQPLVNDLNGLLGHQEEMVRRALAKAGDLAHGLKTPLAVLAQEADRAEAAGHSELAATIHQQVERMRRQVEYHLAHARAAASGATPGARCEVVCSAEGLARTLRRLYAGRGLEIEVRASPAHVVRAQREDLDEMLGNLLDNACKWAATRVVLDSHVRGDRIVIAVDDDGLGIPEAMRAAVLKRGVRADEAAPGSGLGLAIVRELAGLYGGSLVLRDSELGGVRVELSLGGV